MPNPTENLGPDAYLPVVRQTLALIPLEAGDIAHPPRLELGGQASGCVAGLSGQRHRNGVEEKRGALVNGQRDVDAVRRGVQPDLVPDARSREPLRA